MELKDKINQSTSVIGVISDIMWQHIVSYQPEYPEIQYFDPEEGNQIVIYSKGKIENRTGKKIKLYGRVIEIKSTPEEGQKIDDKGYREYHLIVEKYEYI